MTTIRGLATAELSVDLASYDAQVNDWTERAPSPHQWLASVARFRLAVTGTVLDCGCGPGHYGRLLGRLGNTVIGLDREQRCVTAAFRSNGYTAVVRGRAQSMPFEASSFHLVLLRYVLHHLDPIQQACVTADIHRTLQANGLLLIETAFPRHFTAHHDLVIYPRLADVMTEMYPSEIQLRELLHGAGFDLVDATDTKQTRRPHRNVGEALARSERLVTAGEGPTGWLRLNLAERRHFHQARTEGLPILFGDGPVPRTWSGSLVLARKRPIGHGG